MIYHGKNDTAKTYTVDINNLARNRNCCMEAGRVDLPEFGTSPPLPDRYHPRI